MASYLLSGLSLFAVLIFSIVQKSLGQLSLSGEKIVIVFAWIYLVIRSTDHFELWNCVCGIVFVAWLAGGAREVQQKHGHSTSNILTRQFRYSTSVILSSAICLYDEHCNYDYEHKINQARTSAQAHTYCQHIRSGAFTIIFTRKLLRKVKRITVPLMKEQVRPRVSV